jgi:hypothetical protein
MPRSLLRCCKEVYTNLRRSRTSNRRKPSAAPVKCMPCCISRAWRNHGEACRCFWSNSWRGCAISAIASRRTSWCPRRRLEAHADAHSTRDALPLRAAGQVQRAESAFDAAARSQPARARLDDHGARAALEQVDAYGNISHLLTIEEPHREIRIVVQGVVETADTEGRQDDGPLSPLAYLAPTALTAPNERLRLRASSRAVEHARSAPARSARRGGLRRGALQVRHQRRAGQRRRRPSRAAKAFARITPTSTSPRRARSGFRRATSAATSTPATPTMRRAMPGSMSGSARRSAGRAST